MIKTVVREHHWAPDQIGALSLFNEDDPGDLEFWYNDVKQTIDDLKKPKSGDNNA